MLDSARGVLASLLWPSSACWGHSVLSRSPCPGNRGGMAQADPKQRKIREGPGRRRRSEVVGSLCGLGSGDLSLIGRPVWWRLAPPLAPCSVGSAPSPAGVSQPLQVKALPQPAMPVPG